MNDLSSINDEILLKEIQRRMLGSYCQEELNELRNSVREISQKLAESEALKSHFISNISNEIVNPFTSILAIADNILGVKKENWKQVIHMVSLIYTEVFNLDFQLKNIFIAAKIEAGEITPEITLINIDQLILNIIKSFRNEAKRKHLQIEYTSTNDPADTVVYFKSDAEKVQLILCNLLSNAIKFSYNKGKILIHAHKFGETLTITVQDFGEGISKANEQIIYDRFKRIDSGINSLNRGHGLGLSIIRALIDMIDGRISFISKESNGTIFKMQINESTSESTGVSTSADEIFFKEETF